MGNGLSSQFQLADTSSVPVTFNESLRSHEKIICQTSQIPNQVLFIEQVNPSAQALDQSEQNYSLNQQTRISTFLDTGKNALEFGHEDLAIENSRVRKGQREENLQNKFTSSNYEKEYEQKLKNIQKTLRSLEDSLLQTRGLETEKSLRYSQLKTKNMTLQINLETANKRNKNMLNLFRQNAVEIGFGSLRTTNTLPESLRKDVQRIWSQKYDTLLEQNNQLKTDSAAAELSLKDKDRQIEDLEQRLLNLAENLIRREETIEKICTKFLSLKQRKDEQETLLRGSVETLQDALQKAKDNVTPSKSESCMIPTKDSLLAREVRRSDRLAYENCRLKALLREAKRSCRSSRTSSTISMCDKNF